MKKFFICFLFLILLTSCESAREGFTLKKKNNSDEFLVEKKNPLVLPPNYNKLPTPVDKENIKEKDEVDFNSSLNSIKKSSTHSNGEVETSSLEDVILKKIK